jgi:hypothetical protein
MQAEFKLEAVEETLKDLILLGNDPTYLRKWVRKELNVGKSRGNEIYRKVYESIPLKERKKISSLTEVVDVPPDSTAGVVGGFSPLQVNGDSAVANVVGVKNLEELIAYAGIDTEEWSCTKQRISVWDNKTSFNAEFRRRVEEKNLEQTKEEIKKELKILSPKVSRISYKKPKEDNLLLLTIFDAHIGKRVVGQDPNITSLQASLNLFKSTVVELVDRALKFSDFSRILFPISQDYLHYNSSKLQTFGGTQMETDLTFPIIVKEGRKLLVWAIDYLKQFAPVDVVYIPSNHDQDAMFQMADAIECWFHNDPNVTIDNSEKTRKYYLFGDDIVIGISHGDKAVKKLPALASMECPEWSRRKHRELLKAHFHKEEVEVIEEAGCIMRTIPSLSGKDLWHEEQGFCGAKQRSQAFIWGKNSGLNTIIYSTDPN